MKWKNKFADLVAVVTSAIAIILSSSDVKAAPPAQTQPAAVLHPKPPRQLIVIMNPQADFHLTDAGIFAAKQFDTTSLHGLMVEREFALRPLFRPRSALAATAPGAATQPDKLLLLSSLKTVQDRFFKVDAPDDHLDAVATELRKLPIVQAAYITPRPEYPVRLKNTAMNSKPAPSTTSDFLDSQGYLKDAPDGIGARSCWKFAGGAGAGVRIVDVEGNWLFEHEDLLSSGAKMIGGVPDCDWNHGTAVSGELVAARNGFGVTGICYDAHLDGDSLAWGEQQAILDAADALQAGDIIVLEVHMPGPRTDYQPNDNQTGYIAVEFWPQYLVAIQYATAKGIIVVEAGGNGGENLDDPIYEQARDSFGKDWKNPFNSANPSSGAILVGAGASPANTHGRSTAPGRSRLDFSNYGSRLDAQGWGEEVTTCGYGQLQAGNNPLLWYTDEFGGTSSATPIVAGSIACVQGVLKSNGRTPLRAEDVRKLLRVTGSLQQDGAGFPASQRIGNQPDILSMLRMIGLAQPKTALPALSPQ